MAIVNQNIQNNQFVQDYFGIIDQNIGSELSVYRNESIYARVFPQLMSGMEDIGIQSIENIWQTTIGVDPSFDPNGSTDAVFNEMDQIQLNKVKLNHYHANKQNRSQVDVQDPSQWTAFLQTLAAQYNNYRENTMLNYALTATDASLQVADGSENDHTADANYKVTDALDDALYAYTNAPSQIAMIMMPLPMYKKFNAEIKANEIVEAGLILGENTYRQYNNIPIVQSDYAGLSNATVATRPAYSILLLTENATVVDSVPMKAEDVKSDFDITKAQSIARVNTNYGYDLAAKGFKFVGSEPLITDATVLATAGNWNQTISNDLAVAGVKIAMAR